MSGLFLDAPVSGAYHLVTWVVTAIQPVTGPYAAAFIDHRLTVPAGKVALLH